MTEIEEAIVDYARAYADLLWEQDQGTGGAVRSAERSFAAAAQELIRLGFNVPEQR